MTFFKRSNPMSKNSRLPPNDSPEVVPATVERSPERAAAIRKAMADGYLDSEGKTRPILDGAHAEFLARAGTIPSLPE